MTDHDLIPPDSASMFRPPQSHSPVVAVIAFVTGFLGVLLLGLGVLVWVVPRGKIKVDIGLEELGHGVHIVLQRFGLGAVLFGLGVWFTLLTRGLWQGRRYGSVLGWITLAVIAVIAIMVAVT
jgi:hypothetical protein